MTLNSFNSNASEIIAVGLQKYSISQHFPPPVFLNNSSRTTSPFHVAVDLRRNSPDFGKWAGFHLKTQSVDDDLQLLWIPEGFAHGFLVLSDTAEVLYKTTNLYYPAGERSILWNDPTLNITWPLDALDGKLPSVSPKDARGALFTVADLPPSA